MKYWLCYLLCAERYQWTSKNTILFSSVFWLQRSGMINYCVCSMFRWNIPLTTFPAWTEVSCKHTEARDNPSASSCLLIHQIQYGVGYTEHCEYNYIPDYQSPINNTQSNNQSGTCKIIQSPIDNTRSNNQSGTCNIIQPSIDNTWSNNQSGTCKIIQSSIDNARSPINN